LTTAAGNLAMFKKSLTAVPLPTLLAHSSLTLLQQQHARVAIGAEAVGQGATSRSGADDDVGVLAARHDARALRRGPMQDFLVSLY
jgi:hypothetical protein